MGKTFLIDALTVLLEQLQLIEPERAMLVHLRAAAQGDSYWDMLARNAHNPFGRMILVNIMIKGRAAGLGLVLEKLKEIHANVPMADDQRNPSALVPAASLVG